MGWAQTGPRRRAGEAVQDMRRQPCRYVRHPQHQQLQRAGRRRSSRLFQCRKPASADILAQRRVGHRAGVWCSPRFVHSLRFFFCITTFGFFFCTTFGFFVLKMKRWLDFDFFDIFYCAISLVVLFHFFTVYVCYCNAMPCM